MLTLPHRILGGKPKDWDSRNGDKIVSGDATAWKQLFALAPRASEPEIWAKIPHLLNVEAFADYMILNLYGSNGDWDGSSNWYSGRRRKPAGGHLFFVWDGERTLEGLYDTRLNEEAEGSPSWLFQRLRLNSAFKDIFKLRAALHLNLGGALSPVVAGGRFKDLADQLEPAMARKRRVGVTTEQPSILIRLARSSTIAWKNTGSRR